jgi:inosine-uridine nucleoside N-ribohydrolase
MKIFYFLLLNLFYAKRLVIVDCDAGIDDIYAIKFLMNEEDVEILAVTT